MVSLKQLFALEIEFHRRLRTEAPGTADASALHTSYALDSGYEPILRGIGPISASDIGRLAHTLTVASDARDVLHARDTLARMLGLSELTA